MMLFALLFLSICILVCGLSFERGPRRSEAERPLELFDANSERILHAKLRCARANSGQGRPIGRVVFLWPRFGDVKKLLHTLSHRFRIVWVTFEYFRPSARDGRRRP